jgi:hypothetical protein
MKVFQGRNNLRQVVLSLHFSQSLSSLYQLIKGVIGADLKQNINIFLVFEYTLKFDNMVIV